MIKTFVVARATCRQRGLLLISSRVFTMFNVKFVSAVIILKGRWDAGVLMLFLNPQRYRIFLARIRCYKCTFTEDVSLSLLYTWEEIDISKRIEVLTIPLHFFLTCLFCFVFTGEICDVLATASEDANIKLIICILFSITRVKCSKTPHLLSQTWFGIDDDFFHADY